MRSNRRHSVDVVFALVLFCVFAASVLAVLISGAGAYGGIADTLEGHYRERVCLSYIATKLRHCDVDGCVSVGSFGGSEALFLDEEVDGVAYRTAIYCYDGWVRELYSEPGLELAPGDGLEIVAAEGLSFTLKTSRLLQMSCVGEGGGKAELLLCLRSGGDAQ